MIEEFLKKRMRSRSRLCIFCGRTPHDRNNEHIIPQWLIDLTGAPSREISLGPLYSNFLLGPKDDIFRSFSFNSFKFPSCSKCNSDFGRLEARASKSITKLLNNKALSSWDFEIILDWFDKVRIGLWLGYHYYLDHNFWGIKPKYFIKDRICTTDRAISIYKTTDYFPGIRFTGINTSSFAHVPSCFTLSINEWCIRNISSQFIIARSAGFPYPESMEFTGDEHLKITPQKGKGKLTTPLLPLDYDRSCVSIGQSIIPKILLEDQIKGSSNDDFIDLTSEVQRHKGTILIEKENTLSYYSKTPSTKWIPFPTYSHDDFQVINGVDTLSVQIQLIERVPIAQDIPQRRKRFIEKEFQNCIIENQELIKMITNDHE